VSTYHQVFDRRFGINPHLSSIPELQEIAIREQWVREDDLPELDLDSWLDLLLTHGIESGLGQDHPEVITDYPASQASLAKVRTIEGSKPYQLAERFEFYYKGIELANGYHELACAIEQRERFDEDLKRRKDLGLCELPIDHYLLGALAAGFPSCAGVALGVDRLFMLKLKESNIAKVLPFAWETA
jgi:lysyl-tRNA synthetase class 2